MYFHGSLAKGFKMYIHKKSGAKVTLLEQDQDGNVTAEANGETQTGPASAFFAEHREATREEIDGATPPEAEGETLKLKAPK